MSEFIFPFASVQDLNDIFNCEKLPFHYFNSLTALPIHNEIPTTHNPVDNIDELLCNNNEVKCKYFQANEFISLSSCSEKFSLLSCNINSASKNLDNFCASYLTGFLPCFITLCETKLNSTIEHLYPIGSYTGVFNSRNNHGGGVSIYVKANVSLKRIDHMCFYERLH